MKSIKSIFLILLLLSSFSYSKSNQKILFTIFKGFAKVIYTEVTKNMDSENSKFYIVEKRRIPMIEDVLSNTVYSWNSAVSSRDTDRLYNLYGYRVLYYGSERTDDKCIADKNRFYKKHPFFTQSIRNIRYKKISDDLYKVSFDKIVKLKKSKKTSIYPSYLVIDTSFNSPLVIVEGDKVTDRNLIKRYR